ncbi:MAG: hypothetical protein SA378_01975 [Sedimentibacter sp.]|uniref:hypothetical protein n=1 Tax=Sedimentibacter sp. TaxID=1960295 RepID=UPI002980FE68|nr:hypothetical protein [Sedimentibacter sp.]MDW5298895.1 hypothetical protein [Sedimentibacter sp.]
MPVQDKKEIRDELINILLSLFEKNDLKDKISNQDDLIYLLSTDSTQAIVFLTLIEDEFQIEIEDDDIDMRLFSKIEYCVDVIQKYIKKNQDSKS